ncbi:MAG: succinate dehydrogenase/fumarate reductase iron-sulfur subunit [Woeseiaceae bacterium]|nr:succinate dehydrogenase/fumarate reductase iron-sulfur subunit [Woeseiaceae bacterium]
MPDRREIDIEVMRYNPETDSEPYIQSFRVPFDEDTSVLMGLQYIKDHLDGSLTFRWSCRMAVCGSCGKMVNGVPKLSCKAFLRDYYPGKLRIEPLEHFPIVRDLAVDQTDFLEKLEAVKPWIIRKDEKPLSEGTYLQTPEEVSSYLQFSSCINCLLCYSACPQYGLDNSFTGPAALSLLHRYNADSRDEGKSERMPLVNSEEGVWGCTLVGYCSEVCPKQVDPAAAVNRGKVNSTMDYFLRFLTPRGGVDS